MLKLYKNEKFKNFIVILLCTVILLSFYIEVNEYIKKTDSNVKRNRLLLHCGYDSYTIQAMHWREGKIKLDQDYPWLELAIYEGDYYVSFPPFPTVPIYFLTFFFGELTPNNILVMVYNILAFIFAFLCCRRMGSTVFISLLGACFTCIASACLFMSMSGGVWFIAQMLAILLTLSAFYFMLNENRAGWYVGMFLLALAVGCRPFQAIYFIFFIYLLFVRYNFKVLKTWTYFIAPGAVAVSYMTYNYVRFKNIFEFGHNYLPEFTRDEPGNYGQFSYKYIPGRYQEFFKNFPKLTSEGLEYNAFGFTFYISNVIFILMFAAIILFLFKNIKVNRDSKYTPFTLELVQNTDRVRFTSVVLLALLVAIHITLFLFHKTAGGWQFGARYMADAVPGALICILYCRNLLSKKAYVPVMLLLSFGMALNIYGAMTMYL